MKNLKNLSTTSVAVFASTFGTSFALLAMSAARDVTLVDSGELILASATGDIAHPPGFPAYVLLGRLFSLLPLGSAAFRLSLMSAFFGAVTLGLLALLLATLGCRAGQHTGNSPTTGDAALFGALALLPLLSESFVAYATVAEVYTLNTALFMAALLLLADLGSAGRVRLLGLLVGLGLAVHHASWVLWAPALALFWLLDRSVSRSGFVARLRDLVPALTWTLLGLATYLYLPLAARSAWLGWGEVTSLQRFWWHISAGQYRAYWSQMTVERWTESLAELGSILAQQYTVWGALCAVLGLILWWRLDRAVVALLVAGPVCTVAYVAAYDIAEDGDAYLLPVFLLFVVAWSAILPALRQVSGSRRGTALSVAFVLVFWTILALQVPAGSGVHRLWTGQGRADEGLARVYVEDLVASVGPGALVLTKDWQFHAPFLYMHRLQGFRPDLTVINLNLLRYSWYLKHLDRAAPASMQACAVERRAYENLLDAWEQDDDLSSEDLSSEDLSSEDLSSEDLTAAYTAFVEALIHHRLNGPEPAEVHLGLPVEDGIGAAYFWLPRGLTFQLLKAPPAQWTPPPEPRRQHLLNPDLRPPASTKVRSVYAFMLRTRGEFLGQAGLHQAADTALAAASELDRASR